MTEEFWATLIGAAVGVVAGALIQYVVEFFIGLSRQRRQRQALKKELQYNLQIVSELTDECRRIRDAVNSDTFKLHTGYLAYERGIFAQSTALLNSGLLYRWFEIGIIQKLQRVSAILNLHTANRINENFKRRQEAAKTGTQYNKTEMVQYLNSVETQINETRKLLNELIAAI